jgi:hypothetical protein
MYDACPTLQMKALAWEIHRLHGVLQHALGAALSVREGEPGYAMTLDTLIDALRREPSIERYEAEQRAHPAPFTRYWRERHANGPG